MNTPHDHSSPLPNHSATRKRAPDWWMPLTVGAVALLMRFWHLWALRSTAVFKLPMGDGLSYDQWARRIVDGDWIGKEVFYQAPLYPYFLALVYECFGADVIHAKLAQAVIGALSCVLIADAGRSFFGRRAGWGAGLLLSIYPTAIFFDGLIQKSVLDLFFMCAALCLAGRLQRAKSGVKFALTALLGASVGALILTRENALLLLPVVGIWAMTNVWRTASTARRTVALSGLIFVLGVASILLPVAVRNKFVGGEFHLTTSQMGPNLFIGNHPGANGTYTPLRPGRGSYVYEREDATALAEKAQGRSLTPAEVSSYWTHRVREFIERSPSEWLSQMGTKTILLVHRIELTDTEDQYTFGAWSPAIGWSSSWLGFGVLFPLAVGGLVLRWRSWRRAWIIAGMLLIYGAGVIMFYVVARYRFPLTPMLILLACAAIDGLWRWKKRAAISRHSWTLFLAIAAAGGAAIASHLPISFSVPQMKASTFANIGESLARNPATAKNAPDYFIEAIRLYPQNPNAYINLATCMINAGQFRQASEYSMAAVKLAPGSADAWFTLGVSWSGGGLPMQAAGAYEKAILLDAERPEFHTNLGNLHLDAGANDRAFPHLQRAVELAPGNAVYRFNLGSFYARSNQLSAAIESLKEAVRLNPKYADALFNLGMAYQKSGRPREAADAFERYLVLVPGDPDARAKFDEARLEMNRRP